MNNDFTQIGFDRTFNGEKIITLFYMELSKNYFHEIETHDYWEMVYIDKGEMLCTAGNNRFISKSGEMTFHKPQESHNLSGNFPYEVKQILTFLEENIYEKITITDVAKYMGKSESSVKQLFSHFRSNGIMHYYNAFITH